MSEADFWKTVRTGMTGRWECERVENRLNEGTPDVTWATGGRTGWAELKWAIDWPATPEGPLKFRSLTEEQRNWIRRFGQAGRATYLLCGVGKELFLFDHTVIMDINWIGKTEMRNRSVLHGYTTTDAGWLWHGLQYCLGTGKNDWPAVPGWARLS